MGGDCRLQLPGAPLLLALLAPLQRSAVASAWLLCRHRLQLRQHGHCGSHTYARGLMRTCLPVRARVCACRSSTSRASVWTCRCATSARAGSRAAIPSSSFTPPTCPSSSSLPWCPTCTSSRSCFTSATGALQLFYKRYRCGRDLQVGEAHVQGSGCRHSLRELSAAVPRVR